MKKRILTLLLLFVPLISLAQELTVNVDSVGQLASQLPDSIRYSMSELKISGPLSGNDLKILQLITRNPRVKKASDQALKVLDLSEATISESKGSFRTKADALPAAMFQGCKTLERVVLPNTMLEVSRSCFSGCVNLKEVELPEGLLTISDYAFNGCVALNEIKLPESLSAIENHAFDGCAALTSIDVPESVEHIDVAAFANCKSLTKVVLDRKSVV